MKKILLLVCCAFAASTAFAQLPTFGIRGGVNFAKLTASSGNLSASTSNTTTFAAGLFADFKVGTAVSIQPALNFTGKGGKVTLTDFGTAGDLKTYYVQVPVNIVYHIPAVIGNVYFGAGPYVGVGVSGKAKGTDDQGNSVSEDIKFGNNGELKRTDLGLNGIAGVEFKGGLILGINYDLGLSNIANNTSNDESLKNRVFGVSVGFKF
ncbi:PorT family protein [Mucilaginibacter rigui]|uniref:PorT family protein n=1 Tax=Mucilaginibacter rigui TaxID=534635 RepID=A0ABR7X702_9SPHI|nr:porin family protein [Mucilaginibacter rigui]MBD1386337.1 PorT family protein [Mucilaginibacter rigui]